MRAADGNFGEQRSRIPGWRDRSGRNRQHLQRWARTCCTPCTFPSNPATGMVDSTLSGTRVLFGGFAAPILYTSATQVNAIVPYEIAGQSQVTMQVTFQGNTSSGTPLPVATAAPGIFTTGMTGAGQAAALNEDGSLNGPSNPVAKGSYVSVYFTGGGQTNPPGVTGSVNSLTLRGSIWFNQSRRRLASRLLR